MNIIKEFHFNNILWGLGNDKELYLKLNNGWQMFCGQRLVLLEDMMAITKEFGKLLVYM